MNAAEIRDARHYLGLSLSEFGLAIGLKGEAPGVSRKIRRIESGAETLSPEKIDTIRRLVADVRKANGVEYLPPRAYD